jgi:hypothetical protein
MDSFKFKCLVVAKSEIPRGVFAKCINKQGPVEVFFYSKKTPVDSLSLIEVTGYLKNRSKSYLVAKEFSVIDRFQTVRESFCGLSFAILVCEIAFKTNNGLSIALLGLNAVKEGSCIFAMLWFLSYFLIYNGIFDKDNYSKKEIALINFIQKTKNKKLPSEGILFLCGLCEKMVKNIESYANIKFSNADILRRVCNESGFAEG